MKQQNTTNIMVPAETPSPAAPAPGTPVSTMKPITHLAYGERVYVNLPQGRSGLFIAGNIWGYMAATRRLEHLQTAINRAVSQNDPLHWLTRRDSVLSDVRQPDVKPVGGPVVLQIGDWVQMVGAVLELVEKPNNNVGLVVVPNNGWQWSPMPAGWFADQDVRDPQAPQVPQVPQTKSWAVGLRRNPVDENRIEFSVHVDSEVLTQNGFTPWFTCENETTIGRAIDLAYSLRFARVVVP